ncbi:hypothetical protein [Ochrovirga pacifica]|uniref:hypothetical protein n=1 Tax=Ochrovirga pacifica TaxID=1042376 RepID=UPI000497F91C|nr:hypothetical protein [Ochrovirga pacifica]
MKFKYKKLVLSILLDAVGVLSYLIPGLTESIDFVWAPLSAYLITKVFQNKVSKYTAIVGFIEEALPFTDIFPTFTVTWILSVWLDKEETSITQK